jgi:hypothetical protein
MTALRKPTEELPFDAGFEPNTPSGQIVTPIDTSMEADASGVPASPARELQQRLEEAALQSFYAAATTEDEVSRWSGRQRLAIIVAAAIGSWAIFFGVGYSLIA